MYVALSIYYYFRSLKGSSSLLLAEVLPRVAGEARLSRIVRKHHPTMAPKQLDARTLAIVCVAAAMLAPWANAQTQPAEITPIPGDGSANANGPTLAPATGAACTVDTDCDIAEFCDCGASGDTTTLAPPGDSPAAPLARTPLALFVGMLATACQQSAHAAAGTGCRCKVGQRTGVSTAQNTANGTDGAGNPSGKCARAHERHIVLSF